MRVLLLGAPGAGKGTQAIRIAQHFGLTRISTGDLLREEVLAGTDLGRAAARYMDAGDLVPDGLVLEMTEGRVVRANALGGYVLDGFPRTLAQADDAYRWALERDVPFDIALVFEVSDEALLERLAGRADGRSDDDEEIHRHRLEVFRTVTYPLVDYYDARGILERVDADGPVDVVTERTFAALHAHRADLLGAGG